MNTSESSITERVLLPSAVRPVHYTLELHPDLTSFKFDGNEKIDLVVHSSTDKIVIHAKDLIIKGFANYKSADGTCFESCETSYNSKLSTVSFTFESVLPLGSGVLSISFEGELNNKMVGFYRSKYYDVDGSEMYMATTQFEPLDARRCFPCYDEPAAKSSFSITLVVPSNLCALSNMPEISSSYIAGGLKRVIFDKTPIMSTYLVAFCVGKFDCLSTVSAHGVSIRVYTPPGLSQKGEFALRVGKASLDYYDDYFQSKFLIR